MRPFEQSLPHVLLRARETTMRFFRPLLADHDLTEQQWRVLRALHRPDNSTPGDNTRGDNPPDDAALYGAGSDDDRRAPDVGELAARTFLLGPSLSRILVNLEGRNLIIRQVDAVDQRRSLISLTAPGRSLVARIAPLSEAQYARIETSFGQQKLTDLFALLEELAAIPAESSDLERTP